MVKHWVISFAFVAYLVSPAVAGLFGVEPAEVENRTPAALPEWSRASWIDEEAYTRLGLWLRDALPLRGQAISLDSWIDYRLLGDSPSIQIIIGPGGDLFMKKSLLYPCLKFSTVPAVLEAAHGLQHFLDGHATEMLLVLSPNKSFIHPDRLPPVGERLNRCTAEQRERLRAELASQDQIEWVDLWSVFEAARDPGDPLFPKLSRHWGPRAGVLQARAIVDVIQPALWDEAHVMISPEPRSQPAELPMRFMNVEIATPVFDYAVVRPGTTVNYEAVNLMRHSHRPMHVYSVTPLSLPMIQGRTVVIHDSFMNLTHAAMGPYFESIRFVHWSDVQFAPRRVGPLLAEADRVIVAVVEDGRGHRIATQLPKAMAQMELGVQERGELNGSHAALGE